MKDFATSDEKKNLEAKKRKALCRQDSGSALAAKRALNARYIRDQHFATSSAQIIDGRLGLGPHAARREVPFLQISFDFIHADLGQRPLVGLAVLEKHSFDPRRDQEQVGSNFLGQQAGGAILVDDRFDSPNRPALIHHDRYAPSSRSYHDDSRIYQGADDRELDDPLRERRSDDPSVAAAGFLDQSPPFLRSQYFRKLFTVEKPNRLRRVIEGRVVGVYDDLSHDRSYRSIDSPFPEHIAHDLLQHETHSAFGICDALFERQWLYLGRGNFYSQQTIADLRAVAVGEYQVKPLFDERNEVSKGHFGVRPLLRDSSRLVRADQCIPADSDNCLLGHEIKTGSESRLPCFGRR